MKVKKSSFLVLIAGGATIASLVLIIVMGGGGVIHPSEYPNKHGFAQAMMWFEMLRTTDEVNEVLGDPSTGEGVALRQAMDTMNTYDFVFMLCYPVLFVALIIFVHALVVEKGHRMPYGRLLMTIGIILSVIMLFGDAFENLQLFKISAYKNSSDIRPEIITTLQVATRIKSLPIFLNSLILAYFYLLYFKKSWGIIVPALYCASALLGFIAITVSSARSWIEAAYNILAVGWLISIIHGGIWQVRSRKAAGM